MDIEFFKARAKRLASTEEHAPVAFFYVGENTLAVPLADIPGEQVGDVIREIAKKVDATEVVFIDEGWVVKTSIDANIRDVGPPSLHPDREEVLMIYHESKRGRITYIAKILNDDGRRIVGEYRELIDGEGNLCRLLPMFDLEKS